MALQASNIADLVATTLDELGRGKFTDLMSDYQKTVAMKRLVKKSKTTFDSGEQVSFNVIVDHNNSARFVGLYATDSVDVPNVMATGNVPWRHITWNWAVDFREPLMNASPAKIVDIVKTRRIAAMGSAIIKFEYAWWRVPATTNDTDPYGLPYWIVKNNTEGFNGGMHTSYTAVGGISTDTQARWKNWTAQYTSVTKDDLVKKVRKALHYTDFEPLVDEIPEYNTGDDQVMYTNYAVTTVLEDLAESQNENIGKDLAAYDGKVVIRGVPIMAIKELDLDTTNPVYGVNWGEMKTMALRGAWMKDFVEKHVPGQHTVAATHTDCTFNWICRNRRRQFVIATNTGVDY